jgi:hypothetical protein
VSTWERLRHFPEARQESRDRKDLFREAVWLEAKPNPKRRPLLWSVSQDNEATGCCASVADTKPAVASVPDGKIRLTIFARSSYVWLRWFRLMRVPGCRHAFELMVDVGTETRTDFGRDLPKLTPPKVSWDADCDQSPSCCRARCVVLESNGMLLAASVGDEGQPVLASFLRCSQRRKVKVKRLADGPSRSIRETRAAPDLVSQRLGRSLALHDNAHARQYHH